METNHHTRPSGSARHAPGSLLGTQSRRAFLERTAAFAVLPATMAAGASLVPAVQATGAPPATKSAARAPDEGTDRQTRGAGSRLRIVLSASPTCAAPHSARSLADYLAAAPVIEPLLHMLPDGTLIPNLVEQVPTIANGLLTKDYRSATFTLLEHLVWSDGEPVTADDLVFTWKWISTPGNGSSNANLWSAVSAVKAVDERTAEISFARPMANWYEPFTGSTTGLYPAHCFGNDPANRNDAFLTKPIGTGPYVITHMSPSGMASYAINERYRDPKKPYFAGIEMSVNTDAAAAADSVLTGASDLAWRLKLDLPTLETIDAVELSEGLVTVPNGYVEALRFNFSDPGQSVHGEVSQKDTPHPVFSDPAVRRALNVAVNRDEIATAVYGPGFHADANILVGLAAYTSTGTGWHYDLDEANRVLDAAGWTREGAQRSRDGVTLAFEIAAPSGDLPRQILEHLRDDFQKIGADITVTQIDPGDFFNSDPAADQSFYHMPWDAGIWADGSFSAFPQGYMRRWYAGEDGDNIAQAANHWLGEREAYGGVIANTQRYINADYDALYDALASTLALDKADDLLVQMNDLLVQDVVEIPIVALADRHAVSDRLRRENLAFGPFVVPLWNIANWNEAAGTAR